MTSDVRQAKRSASAVPAARYGRPALVTMPIVAWAASLTFDIGSRVDAGATFLSPGARWLIAIGVVGVLVAAMAGCLDLAAVPTGTRAFRITVTHLTLNVVVAGSAIGNFFWRDTGFHPPGPVAIGPLLLSVVTLAVLGVSGRLVVHRH
jgi:uncharacterized membrane protein